MIECIHYSLQLVGKIPARSGEQVLKARERKALHEEMKAAIEREDYEEAANLRDRLKEFGEDEAL